MLSVDCYTLKLKSIVGKLAKAQLQVQPALLLV